MSHTVESLTDRCKAAMPGFRCGIEGDKFVARWDSGRFRYELSHAEPMAVEVLRRALSWWPTAAQQENGCVGFPNGKVPAPPLV